MLTNWSCYELGFWCHYNLNTQHDINMCGICDKWENKRFDQQCEEIRSYQTIIVEIIKGDDDCKGIKMNFLTKMTHIRRRVHQIMCQNEDYQMVIKYQ